MGKTFMTPPKRGENFHDPTKKQKKISCPPKITRPHRTIVYDRSLMLLIFASIDAQYTTFIEILQSFLTNVKNWQILADFENFWYF